MISMIQPVAVGNALRVFLEPPGDARSWKLLRKLDDTFTGSSDPDAVVVHNGDEKAVLDTLDLVNGVPYFYRAYYDIGPESETATATPAASYTDTSTDALTIVRDRLDLGLQVEVQRNTLSHSDGRIPVLTAPPVFEDTRWPVVTVHLLEEKPIERGIGEMIAADEFTDPKWVESEGWLAKVQLSIMGWSLNPDERVELRKALRRIVVANMPVFDFAGMTEVQFQQQDMEDFESFNAPVYQVMCTLDCMAPVRVGSDADAITDVTATIIEE